MTASRDRGPTAFVSWAHSDDAWQQTIARFVVALREFGIDADVDLFHAHDGTVDWSNYGPLAIKENDFVLIAASPTYKQRWEDIRTTRTGAGAAREANVLKDLFDRDPIAFFKKVIIVVLPDARNADIPSELASGLPRFVIPEIDERHLEDLLRRLTGQPAYVPAPPGRVPILPQVFIDVGGTVRASEEHAGNHEVASSLAERLTQVDQSIATTPVSSEHEWIDLKAQRTTLSAALELITNRPTITPTEPSHGSPAHGRRVSSAPTALVLGCMMGRRSLYCRALAVRATGRIPTFADIRLLHGGRGSRLPPDQRGSEKLYEELAAVILGATRDVLGIQPAAQISTIGIGTPGVVEVSTGRLLLSVTVPDGSDIPTEIATRMMDKGPEIVEQAFGVPPGEPRRLADRILVDNDVRCVARHYLSQHNWANFACVYVGSGVGAGMVVDGHVYYGSNGSAGHIGHIELERGRAGWPLDDDHDLLPVQCDCGILGFHFDPMANFSGLERIAHALASKDVAAVLSRVQDAYRAAGTHPVDFYREGFPRLLAFAHRRDGAGVPESVLTLLEDRTDIDRYLERVLNAHTSILAAGIATLTEVFDPGNVVLCGPLIDILRTSDGFYRTLRRLLPEQVFHHLSTPRLTVEGQVREALWRGAALLPCERGFPVAIESGQPKAPSEGV